MSELFEALGDAETPGGTIRLWRRKDLALGVDVHEVKLGDEYLMTSLFPDSEIALSRIGLERVHGEGPLDVVVGGLGLGFTAVAALEDQRIRELVVIEFNQAVIDWTEQHLVPGAAELVGDPRTRLVQGDFFAMATSQDGLDPDRPGRTFDALLVDIDHTPEHHLDGARGDFYTAEGLARVAHHLRPGGIFALWSDGRPLDDFTAVLGEVFDEAEACLVEFDNIVTKGTSVATIYVGRRRA